MYSLERIFDRIWAQKVPFFGVFFVIVLLTYTVLFVIDFIPEPITETDEGAETALSEAESIEPVVEPEVEAEPAPEVAAATIVTEIEPLPPAEALPNKIIIDKLDKEIAVLNPEARDIPSLDEALLEGVVRHPDSADFSDPGNIFILGHSSYLPNVFNKNFQAFNGIQELDWGDKIRLQSDGVEYIYFVEEVYQAAASDVIVPHTPGKANLTLATCNSFGSKDDRFIVEAKLVDTRTL